MRKKSDSKNYVNKETVKKGKGNGENKECKNAERDVGVYKRKVRLGHKYRWNKECSTEKRIMNKTCKK